MLSIHVITVGRDKSSWISDQIEHFRKLISKYAQLEITTVSEEHYGKGRDISRAMAAEARGIESRLKGGFLYILDTNGKSYDTPDFAAELARLQTRGISRLEFVIGGPYGLDKAFKEKSHGHNANLLRLSTLTMSHQIVRLVLMEQLSRVLNLNAGGGYHK